MGSGLCSCELEQPTIKGRFESNSQTAIKRRSHRKRFSQEMEWPSVRSIRSHSTVQRIATRSSSQFSNGVSTSGCVVPGGDLSQRSADGGSNRKRAPNPLLEAVPCPFEDATRLFPVEESHLSEATAHLFHSQLVSGMDDGPIEDDIAETFCPLQMPARLLREHAEGGTGVVSGRETTGMPLEA